MDKIPDKNQDDISSAAATLGRRGGQSKSKRKQAAARENGKLGGRPKKRSCANCKYLVDASTFSESIYLCSDKARENGMLDHDPNNYFCKNWEKKDDRENN